MEGGGQALADAVDGVLVGAVGLVAQALDLAFAGGVGGGLALLVEVGQVGGGEGAQRGEGRWSGCRSSSVRFRWLGLGAGGA
ncbi:hypothetical protein GXW82_43875 [Streptacidiphilus sp. 4-A2]|nr:hypothetical protein [Streptacidiphilus sp. 4-A2]